MGSLRLRLLRQLRLHRAQLTGRPRTKTPLQTNRSQVHDPCTTVATQFGPLFLLPSRPYHPFGSTVGRGSPDKALKKLTFED